MTSDPGLPHVWGLSRNSAVNCGNFVPTQLFGHRRGACCFASHKTMLVVIHHRSSSYGGLFHLHAHVNCPPNLSL